MQTPIDAEHPQKDNPARVALVTGGSRGIGRAIALELADKGLDIVINNSKNEEEGNKVVDEIKKKGRQALYVKADVADFKQVEKMMEKIISTFGRIDVLINNAGIILDKKLHNMTEEMWDKVISINLKGLFNCTKLAVKFIQTQGKGRIVNISSISGKVGYYGQANYAASKGGMIAFTKSVAREYAPYGITVNTILPGLIETDILKVMPPDILQSQIKTIPLGRMGKPEEIAKLVSFLTSDDAAYITGESIKITGGMHM